MNLLKIALLAAAGVTIGCLIVTAITFTVGVPSYASDEIKQQYKDLGLGDWKSNNCIQTDQTGRAWKSVTKYSTNIPPYEANTDYVMQCGFSPSCAAFSYIFFVISILSVVVAVITHFFKNNKLNHYISIGITILPFVLLIISMAIQSAEVSHTHGTFIKNLPPTGDLFKITTSQSTWIVSAVFTALTALISLSVPAVLVVLLLKGENEGSDSFNF